MTSPIVAKDLQAGWVETYNTRYTLGKPSAKQRAAQDVTK